MIKEECFFQIIDIVDKKNLVHIHHIMVQHFSAVYHGFSSILVYRDNRRDHCFSGTMVS